MGIKMSPVVPECKLKLFKMTRTGYLMSSSPKKSTGYVLSKPVSSYMDTEILLLDVNTSTRTATRILQNYERYDIIVTDDKVPIGIVTDDDILRKVGDARVTAEHTVLGDIMSAPLITVGEKTTLQEALHIMRDNNIRKLPVLSKKNLVVGMIQQTRIASIIRNASVMHPRLLSPPVKAILGNLGFVLQFAGVLLLVPAIVATIVLDDPHTATGIYLTTVLLLVTGFFLNSYGEKSSLNMQQASVLVFSSLFILTLFGTIPYMYLAGETTIESFASGFFSSAAGFTTGGISLYDTPEDLPQSFTFYRSFTQLVGGMSFIYLVMTAFYPEGKLQSMRGFISGKTLHMRELFGTITVIFTLYIVIVAVLLWIFGERGDIINNLSLAMSTLATGGFLPNSTILQGLVWQEHLILMAAMILGALPFTFHYGFVRKKFLSPKLGREVLVYFAVLICGILLFTLLTDFAPVLSAFYTVSASTTAGLQLSSLSGLNAAAHTVLIILMIVGGCGFSTAGGIKIYRFFHLRDLRKMLHAKSRSTLLSSNKKEIVSTIIILTSFPIIALITAGHLSAVHDADLGDSFFEAVGVITTGGLSAGIITPETDPATKIALGFVMIIGRLEIIALVYIFVPKLGS